VNDNYLILLFPVIPLLSIFLILTGKYIIKKDASTFFLFLNNIVQIIIGVYLTYVLYYSELPVSIHLGDFKYPIIFSVDRYKLFFLVSYLIPLFFSLFKISLFKNSNIKIIFLFFLTGSSGLIVTGDLFNFYVFYELMIMNAYILISMHKKYYASFKYMVFGVLSSIFFLAGIIIFYTYSGDFNFLNILDITSFELNNFKVMLLFFLMAFLIKGGFFPVSSWVTTCHSAPNSVVASFLSSFTITSGIRGMLYLVIIPVIELNWVAPLYFIRILSVLTFVSAGIFIFFEKELKRCIALSTCFAIGVIAYSLTLELYYLALTYMVIHSFYKTVLFHLIDDLESDDERLVIFSKKITFFTLFIMVLFAAGFFPSLTYFFNKNAFEFDTNFYIINFFIMIFVLGGFLKFRFIKCNMKNNNLFYLVIFIFLSLSYYYFYLIDYIFVSNILFKIFNLIILLLIYYYSRRAFKKLKHIDNVDTTYVFKNLNYDIMYILILFIVCMIVFAL
jgi:formate hydrogenlyase subunit 3/multisubunit Na+/H+ antiporter MnhD subunit